ncbi:unnamed protein product [Caenorhabditis sp. 36 PRJEB53466]|nr:unnamed protein product [Caenorhabditis sp. 36 PRJEB53466]
MFREICCESLNLHQSRQQAQDMVDLYKIYLARMAQLINRDEVQEYEHLVDCFISVWKHGTFVQYKFKKSYTLQHMEDIVQGCKKLIEDLYAIDGFLFKCVAAGLLPL